MLAGTAVLRVWFPRAIYLGYLNTTRWGLRAISQTVSLVVTETLLRRNVWAYEHFPAFLWACREESIHSAAMEKHLRRSSSPPFGKQNLWRFWAFVILSFKTILYSFLFLFIWFDSSPFVVLAGFGGLSQIFRTTPNAFALTLRKFLKSRRESWGKLVLTCLGSTVVSSSSSSFPSFNETEN